MFKKVPYPVTVVFSFAVFLSCSRFDETTSLGKDIFKDVDSSQVSFDDNFKTISTDVVAESYSIPRSDAYTNFGVHGGSVIVGGYDQGIASGYFEFAISGAEIRKLVRLIDIKSVTIKLDTINPNNNTKNPTLPTILYAATDASRYKHTPLGDSLGAFKIGTDSILKIEFPISCTNQLLDSLAKTYQELVSKFKSADSAFKVMSKDTAYLRFLVFNNDSTSMMRFRTPKIFVTYTGHLTDSLITDTLFATYMNYAVKEYPQDNSVLINPYSSYATGRIAVFKLDLQQFWDTVTLNTKGLHHILSATMSIAPQVYKTFEASDSSYKVRYLVSENEIKDCFQINAQQAFALTGKLRNDSLKTDSLISADTLCLDIAPFLQRFALSKPNRVYLYLQLTEADLGWKQILWGAPKFQAILTTLR
ncbi:MAG: hypothetical protein GX640_01780 [Fibrobacter sp.]|nr:hypothetical protein [Fibrobacter sp.]